MNSTIFSPGGFLTSVAEGTGVDMKYAVFTQDPADRPSPGGIGARPVQIRWTIERGAIQIPKHQLLFPVGEAKGPCEIEVYPLESCMVPSSVCALEQPCAA